jgi:ferrous iron transport protein B
VHSDSALEPSNGVVLVGAPNCGKTTLYNWLTNSKFKTVNYPGATVEYSLGGLAERYHELVKNGNFQVADTPGTYSLFAKSADEEVTLNVLYKHPINQSPAEKIILVVDGTQMARHLLLAKQLRDAGFSFVIAMTMSDILRANKIDLDISILENEFSTKVIMVDGLLGGGIPELIKAVDQLPATDQARKLDQWSDSVLGAKLERAEALATQVTSKSSKGRMSHISDRTLRIDRLLLHPVFGVLIFFIIMWTLFSAIYWGASPLMELVDTSFKLATDALKSRMPEGLLVEFLSDGVLASFGAILVFVPQIFILFLGIGFLESSGYLARAATLIDRPFSKVGMSGRSFVPILSGFACAVPAIMATRNIGSKRDRMITNFIIPLMSCSARLPVYALLLGFVFSDAPAWKAGFALASLYIGSIVVGAIAAGILNKILAKNEASFFMMELPMYHRPRLLVLLKQSLVRTQSYVKRAGPIIFVFAVLIWAGMTFPHYEKTGTERLQNSVLGVAGQTIEPVFEPMGVDWRVGVGLMAAFAAREVFVSSLAVMFNTANDDESAQEQGLLATMREATNSKGQKIFTLSSVAGLLIFFIIALQCMSTVAVQARESGSIRFAVVQLVAFNIVAYVLAVVVVQGLRSIGIA